MLNVIMWNVIMPSVTAPTKVNVTLTKKLQYSLRNKISFEKSFVRQLKYTTANSSVQFLDDVKVHLLKLFCLCGNAERYDFYVDLHWTAHKSFNKKESHSNRTTRQWPLSKTANVNAT